MDVLDPKH
jgi:hypothetical protein